MTLQMDNQYNKQKIVDRIYFPMTAPSRFGQIDSPDIIIKRWTVFNALPENEKDRMLAKHVPFVLRDIAEAKGFSESEIVALSGLVRDLFFGIISRDDISGELQRRITKLSSLDAKEVGYVILYKILTADVFSESTKTAILLRRLSLEEALAQYSNINEQLVTTIPLVLRISPNPVRPTVKNWITDYHEQMGLGKHETFDRGNYLFHSENSKRLEAEDRRKLSLILRSLDEGTPLMIDPEKQEIVFDEVAADSRQQATENSQNKTYGNKSVAPNLQQTTDSQKYEIENRQPKTINLRQDMNDAPQMRQDVRPAALTTNMQQEPMRPVQPPQNLPHATEEKLSQYFGVRPGASAAQRSNQYQQEVRNMAPKKEFENKSPDFSQLLRTQNNVSEDADRSVTAKGNQPSDEDLKPAGGTVSFSSPQQLSVEREKTIKRSPYRITPHSDTVV